MKNKILIFSATYNEVGNIENFLDSIEELNLALDILIIDDNSPDNTWKKISQLQQLNKEKILGIKLSRNFGHQNSVIAGLNYCKSDFVLIIDADLQDPPEILGEMILKGRSKKTSCPPSKEERQGEHVVSFNIRETLIESW